MALVALAYCPNGECRTTMVGGMSTRNSVEISAAVGEDAQNRRDDVRVIQDALNQVPPTSGGPVPPLKVDGLCYGKTLAAIRRFQKEACGFKWPDGRISPGGKTHTRLREFFIPANPYTMPRIYQMLPQALLWILAAKRVLGLAELHLRGQQGFSKPFQLVDKYFHVGTLAPVQKSASITRIRDTFNNMERCIGHSSPMTTLGSGYFQEDPLNSEFGAYTFFGGFTRRSRTKTTPPLGSEDNYENADKRQDTISVCSRVLNSQSDGVYTRVIVHELAHFCGPEVNSSDVIEDHSYRQRPNFFQLTPRQAIRTADCYSEFAGEAKLGVEPPRH
jgi:hypothetical protein